MVASAALTRGAAARARPARSSAPAPRARSRNSSMLRIRPTSGLRAGRAADFIALPRSSPRDAPSVPRYAAPAGRRGYRLDGFARMAGVKTFDELFAELQEKAQRGDP